MEQLIKKLSFEENWFIDKKWTDSIFIIGCPIISLILISLFCEPRGENVAYNSKSPFWFGIACSILTHAHVLLVFARSHFNQEIFKKFPFRFTIIPLIVLIFSWIYNPFFSFMLLLSVYWDEWHSFMQTFGFGRIYDGKYNNDKSTGRYLDMGMSFVVGFLPSLILLTYLPGNGGESVADFLEISNEMTVKYSWMLSNLRYPLIAVFFIFPIFYFYNYYKSKVRGYHFSKAKLYLYLSTGITSVYISSRYTIADGIFFGNIYHAIQYVFIVMVSEKSNLTKLVSNNEDLKHRGSHKKGLFIFWLLIIPIVFIFSGLRQMTEDFKFWAQFWVLTSLLHFWFDGFIWSVRKNETI